MQIASVILKVVPKLVIPTAPESLLQVQILGPNPRPTE